MSKSEDFEKAPIGATATHKELESRAMKLHENWILQQGIHVSDEEMAQQGYTLDSPVPTTAREALDLAWNLAHPVKEGQYIPKGTRYVRHYQDGRLATFTATEGWTPTPRPAEYLRTLEPLPEPEPEPEPEPDWLDAPAVLAHVDDHNLQQEAVFTTVDFHNRWSTAKTDWTFHWSELRDVTPLYPREDA